MLRSRSCLPLTVIYFPLPFFIAHQPSLWFPEERAAEERGFSDYKMISPRDETDFRALMRKCEIQLEDSHRFATILQKQLAALDGVCISLMYRYIYMYTHTLPTVAWSYLTCCVEFKVTVT